MAQTDTKNADTIPKTKINNSVIEKFSPTFKMYFKNLKPLAPNITGIPRKKVNSAATVREVPARIPPIMVEPEREVPGITDNT